MRPAPVSFWKAGHVCLVWPKILVTRQRLGLSHLRAVLFTPLSGSISQQHCITLTGFPHLTERNLIRFLPPPSQPKRLILLCHSSSFGHSTVSFLIFAVFCVSARSVQQKLNCDEDCFVFQVKNPSKLILT